MVEPAPIAAPHAPEVAPVLRPDAETKLTDESAAAGGGELPPMGLITRLAPNDAVATLASVAVVTALPPAPTAAPTCAAALGMNPTNGSCATQATSPRDQCSLPRETFKNARTT